METSPQPRRRVSRTSLLVCLALTATTLAAYSQVFGFDFLNYDDPGHLSHNPHVRAGLTLDGMLWAFSTFSQANWFPVTWLSHMLCYQLFGSHAGMHHLVNVLIHILAALSLFGFLAAATGARRPAAFVAFVFALHPMHVESVAWVTERKDVLCALFWFLALRSWVRDATRTGIGRYLDTILFFTLGLMSKPMIVTFPFTLILLDGWPLRRNLSMKLVVEKWPFFALSAAGAVMTVLAQSAGGAVQTLARYPLNLRVENALVTVWIYIFRTVWPAGLGIAYSWPPQIPFWQTAAAAAAILAVSACTLRAFRERGYLAFGWFWFLGTLLPVIGLVQVGPQARADRYMYVPMVGVLIMLAWTAEERVAAIGARRLIAVLAGAACLAMAVATWVQTGYWRTAEALFRHSTQVNPNNYLAWSYLGSELSSTPARRPEALADLQTAVRLNPGPSPGHNNLANIYALLDRRSEARAEYEIALQKDPANSSAHDGLGKILLRDGQLPEATVRFRTSLRTDPANEEALMDLASALLKAQASNPEAIGLLEGEVKRNPNNVSARNLLGATLVRIPGRLNDGVDQLEQALALYPGYAEAHNNLGIALSSSGRASLGTEHFEEAVRINPRFAEAQHNLGVALLQVPGRQTEAAAHLKIARELEQGVEQTR